MFTVSVETRFLASHQLGLSDGSKEPLHSHNWQVSAKVSSNRLDRMGFVIDFRRLKTMLDNIVAQFNSRSLNTIDCFRQNNSSAENVAKYIYSELEHRLPEGLKLENIRVVEEPGCSAQFGR
jgi:6-pyruvoyltetrahydropterin/6-carboxytetrahydropterin synthase